MIGDNSGKITFIMFLCIIGTVVLGILVIYPDLKKKHSSNTAAGLTVVVCVVMVVAIAILSIIANIVWS